MEDSDAAVELVALLPQQDICRCETVVAALRDGAIVVRSNGTRDTIAAADYRSLTNEQTVPHANARHSLYRGRSFMVGALARLTINADRLNGRAMRAIERLGLALPSDDPMDNNKAQAVELVAGVERSLRIVEGLLDSGLKQGPGVAVRPRAGIGTAVTEAPRGLLVHSYTYDDNGAIAAADVVTPTAMNAASVESHFRSVVEQSGDQEVPVLTRKLEMLARAYDPCLSCSVHLVRKRHAT